MTAVALVVILGAWALGRSRRSKHRNTVYALAFWLTMTVHAALGATSEGGWGWWALWAAAAWCCLGAAKLELESRAGNTDAPSGVGGP